MDGHKWVGKLIGIRVRKLRKMHRITSRVAMPKVPHSLRYGRFMGDGSRRGAKTPARVACEQGPQKQTPFHNKPKKHSESPKDVDYTSSLEALANSRLKATRTLDKLVEDAKI